MEPLSLYLLYSALEGDFLPVYIYIYMCVCVCVCVCVCMHMYLYTYMFYFVFKLFETLEQLSNMNIDFFPLMMQCDDSSFCQQLFP